MLPMHLHPCQFLSTPQLLEYLHGGHSAASGWVKLFPMEQCVNSPHKGSRVTSSKYEMSCRFKRSLNATRRLG